MIFVVDVIATKSSTKRLSDEELGPSINLFSTVTPYLKKKKQKSWLASKSRLQKTACSQVSR